MGLWYYEIVRMGMYISFPVIMFTYINNLPLTGEWLNKEMQKIYPTEDFLKRRKVDFENSLEKVSKSLDG